MHRIDSVHLYKVKTQQFPGQFLHCCSILEKAKLYTSRIQFETSDWPILAIKMNALYTSKVKSFIRVGMHLKFIKIMLKVRPRFNGFQWEFHLHLESWSDPVQKLCKN